MDTIKDYKEFHGMGNWSANKLEPKLEALIQDLEGLKGEEGLEDHQDRKVHEVVQNQTAQYPDIREIRPIHDTKNIRQEI